MKHIVLSFGRASGITSGHEKVFKKVQSLSEEFNAEAHIYLSRKHDNKTNPLTFESKINFCQKMMPELKDYFKDDNNIKDPFDMLRKHSDKNAILHIVAGGDRIKEFQVKFDKYNGKEYHYKLIKVHNAGERNDGISGTFIRNLAVSNNFSEFKKFTPSTASEQLSKELFDMIRENLILEA